MFPVRDGGWIMTMRTVFLFPGLGGYLPGAFSELAGHPAFSAALAPVDQAAREYGLPSYTELLADAAGPDVEDLARTPIRLHLAAFATSVAVHAVLQAEGVHADAVLGLSTGELAALVVSGCLSSYDAARVFCERELALSELDPGGGLIALEVDAERAAHLCGATGDQTLRPSLFNAPRQTAVSGREPGLTILEKVARAAGVQATRLPAVFPYHNPLLTAPARRLTEVTSDYALGTPSLPAYSPLLNRYVRDAADVREIIVGHLTNPVHFVQAIQRMYASGTDWFIEVGARSILTELATQSLPAQVKLTSPLQERVDLATLLAALGASPNAPVIPAQAVRSSSTPPAPPAPAVRRGWDQEPATPAPVDAVPTYGTAVAGARSNLPARAELAAELRRMFADALGYPEDVFTDDAHLEADLGIASVRKTELLVQVLDKYDLPTPTSTIRVRDFNTLPKLADLVHLLAEQPSPAAV
jgi:[acyl-carrier-protein] S-malonyltransferase